MIKLSEASIKAEKLIGATIFHIGQNLFDFFYLNFQE